jgi:tRNA(Ile2) C34 agmatinyltransferase TiaS
MSFDGSRPPQRQGAARAFNRTVGRVLQSLRQGLAAWRITHRTMARPDAVVIGTLRRPCLAIAIRAAVVPTESTPPPLVMFLERIVTHPLRPSCPRCSLPLEPWHGEAGVAGQPIGYACRPCGTRIRWTPADVLKQMKREVRRHYAYYWAQYREAIRHR